MFKEGKEKYPNGFMIVKASVPDHMSAPDTIYEYVCGF